MFTHIVGTAMCLLAAVNHVGASYISYTTVTGYFLQDDNSTNATTFDYTATNFGLINQTYASTCQQHNLTQWQHFALEVANLNRESPANTTYKVLFMGRHGEGYHNAAESFYGTPAWNCYWSLLDGNATTVWADAHLTQKGTDQALTANAFWAHELTVAKTPAPQSYYTSPLYRCLATANLTFSGLPLPPHAQPFVPTVKEYLREGISEHTCDRRSNRSVIHASFPQYRIEPGFTEQDELWTGIYSETPTGQDVRSKSLLDDIFSHDHNTWISFTSHSGEIASILRVLGHRVFSLNTGAIIPVLVKAETARGSPAVTATATSPSRTPSAHCTSPPLSSVSGGPCVCGGSVAPVTTALVTQAR